MSAARRKAASVEVKQPTLLTPSPDWPAWLGPRPQPQIVQTARGPVALPLLDVRLVPIEKVRANSYNPNHVAQHNMDLLEESIRSNGFLYAVSVIYDPADDMLDIIDGFHRYLIWRDRLQADVVPVTFPTAYDIAQRMEATVQLNRARGVHQVELMADLVQALVKQGVEDEEIATKLGMEAEEVYRLKQITGIAELFKNQIYSRAWEMAEITEVSDGESD